MLRVSLTVACLAALAGSAAAQRPTPAAMTTADQARIASATAAGPRSITQHATVMDWPATPGGPMRQLRAGTNGWVCMPSSPPPQANDAMCFDQAWAAWGEAFMAKRPAPPAADHLGVAYMLSGDAGASNVDPFARTATPDNQWVVSGPHLMVLVPDAAALQGVSADPHNGGPWVMWKGTPYAHLMVPVSGETREMHEMH